MRTYRDLIELARICREQARAIKTPDVAAELRRMAKEYERRAAQLENQTSNQPLNPQQPPPAGTNQRIYSAVDPDQHRKSR
jgi:hypothetical protein